MMDSTPHASELVLPRSLLSDDPQIRASVRAALFGESGRSENSLAGYRVIKVIGRGGMGVVYAARDERLERTVAIKRLRRGLVGEKGTERFLREARALAKLSDPNIVTLHDVRQHDDELLMVMEYVEGKTLADWIALDQPRWAAVVPVFVQAARGLAAAHRLGIVHGDFKPHNAILGNDGRVRVLDFGLVSVSEKSTLALAPESNSPELMNSTRGDELRGTPAYLSPEQWGGHPRSVFSDQFSFCVSLHEALFGQRPYNAQTPLELASNVIAGRRVAVPRHISVPGWLERVVDRGLATRPEDRWTSMEALLEALERKPRNRRVWFGASIIGTSAALGAFSWATATNPTCTGALESIEESWNDGRRARVQTAMQGAGASYGSAVARRIGSELDRYAEHWAETHTRICEATRVRGEQSERLMDARIGCLERARVSLEAAVWVLSRSDAQTVERAHDVVAGLPRLRHCRSLGRDEADVERPPAEAEELVRKIDAQIAQAEALQRAGRFEEQAEAMRRARSMAEGLSYPPVWTRIEIGAGYALLDSSEPEAAEAAFSKAQRSAMGSGQWKEAIEAMSNLVYVYATLVRLEEAQLTATFLEGLLERHGDAEARAAYHGNLGVMAAARFDFEASARHHAKALEVRLKSLPSDHVDVAAARDNLGVALAQQGKFDEARVQMFEALEIWEELAPNHPNVGFSLNNLGNLAWREGDLEEAERFARRAVEVQREAVGEHHSHLAFALASLAAISTDLGKYEEARRYFEEALEIQSANFGPESSQVAVLHNNLSISRQRAGDLDGALRHAAEAASIGAKSLPSQDPRRSSFFAHLGSVAVAREDHGLAEASYRTTLDLERTRLDEGDPELLETWLALGRAQLFQGRLEEASVTFDELAATATRVHGPESEELGQLLGLIDTARREYDETR